MAPTTIQSPEELQVAVKAAQVDTGCFYQPFVALNAERVEIGWDGTHFVLRTEDGPRAYGEEVIAGILPLRPIH
ncbi:MAG: hypothetical protein AzoDbin1_01893 [Azoarcus sp.]|nr:hypothetical protein [Azoarcus sp.]